MSMIHLKDVGKVHGIRCNRWHTPMAYITDDASKVTCKGCRGLRAANRVASADLTGMNLVGKILHASWGYNMTNNSYYLITKQSAKSVIAVAVGSKIVSSGDGPAGGKELPDPTNEMGWNHKGYSASDPSTAAKKFIHFSARSSSHGVYFVGGDLSFGYYNLHDGQPDYFNHWD